MPKGRRSSGDQPIRSPVPSTSAESPPVRSKTDGNAPDPCADHAVASGRARAVGMVRAASMTSERRHAIAVNRREWSIESLTWDRKSPIAAVGGWDDVEVQD